MFAMFKNFFAMFATLFEAGNKLANAGNHAASYVEGEAAAFNERASLQRMQDLKALRSKFTVEDQAMAAQEALAVRDLNRTLEAAAEAKPAQAAA